MAVPEKKTLGLFDSELIRDREIKPLPQGEKRARRGTLWFALEKILARHSESSLEPVILGKIHIELSTEGIKTSQQRISQLYNLIASETSVPPLRYRLPKEDPSVFDDQVIGLSAHGFDPEKVLRQLLVPIYLIKHSLTRIRMVEGLEREERISELLKQKYGPKQIAGIIGLDEAAVARISERLHNQDTSLRLRKIPRTKAEAEKFRNYIVDLRLDSRNLTIQEIADITGETRANVTSTIIRLISEGRIPRRND